jgi:class 3 adenylate cyclase
MSREAVDLLESQIEAINRFPDQNPNPVLRMADDGRLTYANTASKDILARLQVKVGDPLPAEFRRSVESVCAGSIDRFELDCGLRTFAILAVRVLDMGFTNIYASDITAEKVVERFPNENPNPVFRVDDEGRLLYANDASGPIVDALGVRVGEQWPPGIRRQILAAAHSDPPRSFEAAAQHRTFSLRPVAVPEFGLINVYATDVTAQKVVAKFPGQNPNPVLRVARTGELQYANDASQAIVSGLGLEVGKPLPAQLWAEITTRLNAVSTAPVEIQAAGLTYELVAVLVEEFDFVNLYGTDVTATRELAAAKAESERLLLNILPPPIADRLRRGERLIADRFEDATLLIADIVGFTTLSGAMPANDLVTLLNDVFGAFDRLVERHGLEKVKTIGDAYMVIGGVPNARPDHPQRVADLALEAAAALEQMQHGLPHPVQCRMGINCGPVVAGVIGSKRTIYDVWGDTVNVASRMESLGVPGRIQVTPAVHERLRERYAFEARGAIEVKGKGAMKTYFLLGRA